jgi:hypothetical protein
MSTAACWTSRTKREFGSSTATALRPAPPDQLLPDVSEPVARYLVATYTAVIVITLVPAARLLGKVLRRPLLVALV